MIRKEQLFVLVKSLSKAEKRYFTIFCRQATGSSNYLKLFDAIDAQQEYDESAIRKKFKKEAFCKQLHVTKNYLRQLILKSLRNYHNKISKDAELKDLLRNVEILYHRELYPHCITELQRAESIARAFEINSGLAEVIGWKRKLEQVTHSQQYNTLTALLQEQEKAIDHMRNTNQHWQHALHTTRTTISGPASSGIAKKMKTLTPENAQTLEAKVLYYNTSYLTSLRNGLQDKAEQALTELLQLLEKFPHRVQEDPAIYISSANNLVSFLVFSKQYDKAIALINRSRALYDSAMAQYEKRSLLKQILRTYNIELEIYRDTKTFEKHQLFIDDIASFIIRHESKIPADYLLSFRFQLASIYFMRKDFDRSLTWVNRILNARRHNTRTDLQVHTRILNLMIHLEQDNLFVLRYFVDSTRRFLKKMKEVQLFEQKLLGFFSAIHHTPKYEHKERFRDLHQELFPEQEASIPATVPDYIDYRSWVEEKMRR